LKNTFDQRSVGERTSNTSSGTTERYPFGSGPGGIRE
jgi:hypothetical protein